MLHDKLDVNVELVVLNLSISIGTIISTSFDPFLPSSTCTDELILTILSISTPDLKYFLGAMLLSTSTWPANWTSFRTLSAGSRSSAILMFSLPLTLPSLLESGLSPEIVSYYAIEKIIRYVSCTKLFVMMAEVSSQLQNFKGAFLQNTRVWT